MVYRQQQQLDRVLLRNQQLARQVESLEAAAEPAGGPRSEIRRITDCPTQFTSLAMTHKLPLRVIPVWLRVLAGIVAAAAALAIILSIRGVPGQVIDVAGFIRLARAGPAVPLRDRAVRVCRRDRPATGAPVAACGLHAVVCTAGSSPHAGSPPFPGAVARPSPASPRVLGA